MLKKLRIFLCSFAVVLSFLVVTSQSQSDAALKLQVRDSNGNAIAGAEVALTLNGGTVLHSVSDKSGEVFFRGRFDGELKVIVKAFGFPATVFLINTNGDEKSTIELELQLGSIKEEVTVTAARSQVNSEDTPVPVSVVTGEDLTSRAVNSVGEIFRSLPGTSTNNEGAFQVRPRIRGLESNRVLILVDGERLNNGRTSTGQSGIEVGLIEPFQIETVEVLRGSGSVLYGTDALAGTVNIITRDTLRPPEGGFRLGVRFGGMYSSNETGRRGNLELNGSSKHVAFRVGQSLERYGNYNAGGGLGEVPNSQSHGGNTNLTGRGFLNENNTIKANYARRRVANIGSPMLVGTFNAFFPFSDLDKVSGRYDAAAIASNLTRLSISAYVQEQKRNFTNILTVPPALPFFPGMYQSSETVTDTRSFGFDLQTDWSIGSRNTLIAGASAFRDRNSDQRRILSSTTASSPNQTVSNSRSVPDASMSNIAFFAQNQFRINPRLKIVGGLRFDRFRTNAEPTTEFTLPPTFTADQIEDLGLQGLTSGLQVANSAATGDLGVVVSPAESLTLSARVGRSFRTPNLFERFFTDAGSAAGFVVGNPNLKAETGINTDVSARFSFGKFKSTVTAFSNTYDQFLTTELARDRNGCPIVIPSPGTVFGPYCTIVYPVGHPPVDVYQTQNAQRVRISGFEAEFETPFVFQHGVLIAYGNFSYLRGNDLTRREPLNFISPARTNIGFRWQDISGKYFADVSSRVVVTQRRLASSFVTSNGGYESGFSTHNLIGGYNFRAERFNLSLYVGVSNIGNRYFSEQFVLAPARGRSFTFGTRWSY